MRDSGDEARRRRSPLDSVIRCAECGAQMTSEGATNAEVVELLIAHTRTRHPERGDDATYERWRNEARRHDEDEKAKGWKRP